MRIFFNQDGAGGGGGSATQAQDGQQTQERQYTEVETLAMKMGWNPDHDGGGDRPFKTAQQFILDSKEIQDTTVKTLTSLKNQNEELVQGMRHLKETYQRSAKAEKQRLEDQIARLQAERDQAIDDADKAKVKDLDTKIQTLENDKRELDQSTQQTASQQTGTGDFKTEAEKWKQSNPWYQTDKVMTDYIDAQSERFRGLPPDMYFERLTQAAKAMFPDKFDGQQTQQAQQTDQKTGQQHQTVVGGQTRQTGAGQKTKYTYDDLSDDQKRMALFYERNKVMTRQEYVDEQVKIRNIPGM